MRLAAYAGASTALAAGVILYAFNQRANFYSACVYLSQSNLCLMILTNLILFIIASFMFGLQRIFYGPLRPIEIEQLYEKAWFAVTETCLAMTIFREEVGAWFLVMFVALIAGKVWGWIGEGRVEVLEQQPPDNPGLVHTRLSLSLALSLAYDLYMLGYCIHSVIQQARPNMMVMFLFEFAILTTCSFSTALRYCISLVESRILKKQMAERLEWRRREVRERRESILRSRAEAAARVAESGREPEDESGLDPLPSEDDVDEMDIEVPGWEAKGQWVLTLDLMTDFVKLGIYTTFFFILLAFYGLPIHIMRDLFLTARSFIKRLTAFMRYRRATQDMNEKYPDATVEEIQREDTCIICREEMRPWSVTNPAEQPGPPANGAVQPQQARPIHAPTLNERSRPKKLPCGHVLHLGCLKSWLERQQVCPICRRPVVDNRQPQGRNLQPGQGAPVAGRAQAAGPGVQANGQPPQANNVRMIQLGPFRFAYGQANNMQEFAQQFPGVQPNQPNQENLQNQPNFAPGARRLYGLEVGFPRHQPPAPPGTAPDANRPLTSIQAQLQQVEQQIMQEYQQLRLNSEEIQVLRQLHATLAHYRTPRVVNVNAPQNGAPLPTPQAVPATNFTQLPSASNAIPRIQQHAAVPGTSVLPSGSSELPPGLTLPDGWSLLPLQRVDQTTPSVYNSLSQLAGNQATTSTGTPVPQPEPVATEITPSFTSVAPRDAPLASTLVPAPNNTAQLSTVPIIPTEAQRIGADNDSTIVNGAEMLPNWGAAQVFGPSSSLATSSPSKTGGQRDTDNSLAASEGVPSTSGPISNGSTVDVESEETSNRAVKGKSKAATVEDLNEEQ